MPAAAARGNPFRTTCNFKPRPHAHTSKLTEMSAAVTTTIFTPSLFLSACSSVFVVFYVFIIHAHSSSTSELQLPTRPTWLAVRTRIGIKCCQRGTDRQTDGQTACSVCATDNYNCVIFFSLATFYIVASHSFLVFHFPFPINTCARQGKERLVATPPRTFGLLLLFSPSVFLFSSVVN